MGSSTTEFKGMVRDGVCDISGRCLKMMIVLGNVVHWRGGLTPELDNMIRVAVIGWQILSGFWTSSVRLSVRSRMFYAVVVNAIQSGLEAFVLTDSAY